MRFEFHQNQVSASEEFSGLFSKCFAAPTWKFVYTLSRFLCFYLAMNMENKWIKIVGWQRFDTRSVKWTVVQHFQLSTVVRLSESRENTLFLFTEEETFWLPMTRRSGCWGWLSVRLFPVHARLTARAKRARQMLQIFKKLQCLTDTSILSMICKRFIDLLNRNRSNDNPFLAYNQPLQLSTFQRPLPVSASVTPVHSRRWVHPKESCCCLHMPGLARWLTPGRSTCRSTVLSFCFVV